MQRCYAWAALSALFTFGNTVTAQSLEKVNKATQYEAEKLDTGPRQTLVWLKGPPEIPAI
jgi:hypothetical protein